MSGLQLLYVWIQCVSSSVADEQKEASALYEDREVVVDANLVTSRQPADLPAFMRETMKQLGL